MTVQELLDDLNWYWESGSGNKQICVLVEGRVYPIEGTTYKDWSETKDVLIMGVEE